MWQLIILIFCMILLSISFYKNKRLGEENKNITKELSLYKNKFKFNRGDKALISNYELIWDKGGSMEMKYKIICEVDIIEVSSKKAKVNPITLYTNNSKVNNDPRLSKFALDYMKNKWIDLSYLDIIIDERHRRDDKLEEILK